MATYVRVVDGIVVEALPEWATKIPQVITEGYYVDSPEGKGNDGEGRQWTEPEFEYIESGKAGIEYWYGAEFAEQCREAGNEVGQGWVYNHSTGEYTEPLAEDQEEDKPPLPPGDNDPQNPPHTGTDVIAALKEAYPDIDYIYEFVTGMIEGMNV